MRKTKRYDNSYKIEAIKLAEQSSASQAIKELGIPEATFYGWQKQVKNGKIDVSGTEVTKPKTAMSLADENKQLKEQVKQLTVEKQQLQEEKEILEAAAIFFAKSRKK